MGEKDRHYHIIISYWNWHSQFIKKEINNNLIFCNNRLIEVNNTCIYKYNSLIFNYLPKILLRLKLDYLCLIIYNFHGIIFEKKIRKLNLLHVNSCHFWIGFNINYIQKIKNKYNLFLLAERSGTYPTYQKKLVKLEREKLRLNFLPAQDRISNIREKYMILDLELCDKILTPSVQISKTFPSHCLKKIVELPLGSNFNYRPNNLSNDKIIIVGGASLRKGIHLLDLIFQNKELTIVMTRSKFRSFLETKLKNNNISWLNTMKRSKLKKVYSQHGYLIMPSVEDGFGMVALEALSLGLIVYVSKFAGVSDLFIKHNLQEFVFDPNLKLNLIDRSNFKNYTNNVSKLLKDATWKNFTVKYKLLCQTEY